MANVNPTVPATFDNVYQLEITDPNEAGPGGILNEQAKALVNRTQYLLDRIAEITPKIPLFRGAISGLDPGGGDPGDPVTFDGDITNAVIFSSTSVPQGGSQVTVLVTFPTIGANNAVPHKYRLDIESNGNIQQDNDVNSAIARKVSQTTGQTSMYVTIQDSFATIQNLTIHIELLKRKITP